MVQLLYNKCSKKSRSLFVHRQWFLSGVGVYSLLLSAILLNGCSTVALDGARMQNRQSKCDKFRQWGAQGVNYVKSKCPSMEDLSNKVRRPKFPSRDFGYGPEYLITQRGWKKVCSEQKIRRAWEIISPQNDLWSCGVHTLGNMLTKLGVINTEADFKKAFDSYPCVISPEVVYKRCLQLGSAGAMMAAAGFGTDHNVLGVVGVGLMGITTTIAAGVNYIVKKEGSFNVGALPNALAPYMQSFAKELGYNVESQYRKYEDFNDCSRQIAKSIEEGETVGFVCMADAVSAHYSEIIGVYKEENEELPTKYLIQDTCEEGVYIVDHKGMEAYMEIRTDSKAAFKLLGWLGAHNSEMAKYNLVTVKRV